MPATAPALALTRRLVLAGLIGVLAALALVGFEALVHVLQHLLWHTLPDALGVPDGTRWWTLLVLGAAGPVVGLALRSLPGHGGHDPATTGLLGEPVPIVVVPGLLVIALLSLAAGVSMGPEAPLIGSLGSLLAWVAVRRALPPDGLVILGMAGLLGAMFGAPVGAAFAFVEMVPLAGQALYEKLVPLLVASSCGALTVILVAGHPQFAIDLPAPRAFLVVDILSAALVGLLGAAAGLGIGVLLRRLYPLAHRLPIVARLTLGGLALGLIAIVAGNTVLFSGQAELPDLLTLDSTGWEVRLLVVAKAVSVAIALAVGFRGGKIFPAVFVGVALGVVVNGLVPGVPLALAVGAATVGIVLAFVRMWLLTLLLVTVIVGAGLTPLLAIALVAAHLLVGNQPEVLAQPLATEAG